MVDWDAWRQVGLTIDAAGGIAFILLGILIIIAKPRTRLSVTFGSFAIVYGLNAAIRNISQSYFQWGTIVNFIIAPLFLASAILLVDLATEFPRRWEKKKRAMIIVAGIGSALIFIYGLAFVMFTETAAAIAAGRGQSTLSYVLARLGFTGELIGFGAFVTIQAVRWPSIPVRFQRHTIIAAGGFLVLNSMFAGLAFFWLARFDDPVSMREGLVWIVAGLVPALVWIAVINRGSSTQSRPALIVGLTGLTASLVFLGVNVIGQVPTEAADDIGLIGVARIAAVLSLGYAILRHQMLDLDVTLKLGIRQSTVAAILIAAIFVLSEGAQVLFGEQNAWVGIIAGGSLVFAMAPLQRFGDRVASAAMPNVVPVREKPSKERLSMYQEMLESAWLDGQLSRSESRMLQTARDKLGLGADEALELERKIRR